MFLFYVAFTSPHDSHSWVEKWVANCIVIGKCAELTRLHEQIKPQLQPDHGIHLCRLHGMIFCVCVYMCVCVCLCLHVHASFFLESGQLSSLS